MQVNTPFEFKTSPRLYTKEAVFNFSRPARGGRCGAQPGLEGVAVPCGVYVHPVELYNVSILEWRTDCRELRRVLLRGALSATAPVLSLAIVGNAAAEYQTSSERTACASSAWSLHMHTNACIFSCTRRSQFSAIRPEVRLSAIQMCIHTKKRTYIVHICTRRH